MARILDECFSPPVFESAFLGHIGGDDFIVVLDGADADAVEGACERVASRFDEQIRTFYAPSDVERGSIVTSDRRGNTVAFPIMGLSMAIVTSADIGTWDVHEVGRVAADLKKRAKAEAIHRGGASGWVRERRRAPAHPLDPGG